MNIYARFSRFRILPDKTRCISCNEYTANYHQGIDIMAFANKSLPMADPQCVRCSACIQVCPTDTLQSSPVLLHEKQHGGPVAPRLRDRGAVIVAVRTRS